MNIHEPNSHVNTNTCSGWSLQGNAAHLMQTTWAENKNIEVNESKVSAASQPDRR